LAKKEDTFEEALQYAWLLLRYRDRSEKEMVQRLGRKGFSEDNAEAVADYLKLRGYLDDERFALSLKRNAVEQRSLGRAGVVQYLLAKGIPAIIAKEVSGDDGDYLESATDLVEKKMKLLKGLDDVTVKRRLWSALARKGYSPDVIKKATRHYYEFEEGDS
jgi:regulatory protein